MANLMTWVRSRLSPTVDGVWCVHCHARRTVRQVAVVAARRWAGKANGRRMVGECQVCGCETSKFI